MELDKTTWMTPMLSGMERDDPFSFVDITPAQMSVSSPIGNDDMLSDISDIISREVLPRDLTDYAFMDDAECELISTHRTVPTTAPAAVAAEPRCSRTPPVLDARASAKTASARVAGVRRVGLTGLTTRRPGREAAERRPRRGPPRKQPRGPQVVECDLCHQVFNNKYTLNRHMPMHRGVFRECHLCGKLLSWQRQNLTRHLKSVHNQNADGAFPSTIRCDFKDCDFVSVRQDKVKEHLLKAHPAHGRLECLMPRYTRAPGQCRFMCFTKCKLTQHQRQKHNVGMEE